MERPLRTLLVGALLTGVCLGCGSVPDELGRLAGAEDLGDRSRLCLTLARLTGAVESGSPEPAREAAQELAAQADDEVESAARRVAAALAQAREASGRWVDDEELTGALADLRAATGDACAQG